VISPQASIDHPVCLCDDRGRVVKTLADRGAGPWRSPDGKTIYFIRFNEVRASRSSGMKAAAMTGRLLRTDASGGREHEIKLPEPVVPCEVKVSLSGQFLAIAGIQIGSSEGDTLIDEESLTYCPRSLYVLTPGKTSWKVLGPWCWPGAWEFSWSPTEDQLALAAAADPSAMVAIASQLQMQYELASRGRQDQTTTGATATTTGRTPVTATTTSGVHYGPFDPLRWLGTDLLSKAPRSVVVGTWSPNVPDVEFTLRLHRPYYAGFEWMPDGRHFLLFSIDGQPVGPSQSEDSDAIFPRFACHRWDTRTGALERIPVPKSSAFAAIPSPGQGKYLLWLCGNQVHELILTDAGGRRARQIAAGVQTDFRPRWQDDHTISFIKQAETPKGTAPDSGPPLRLVTVDVRTMKSVERDLQSPGAFRSAYEEGWFPVRGANRSR
jgi:hypothetical protein